LCMDFVERLVVDFIKREYQERSIKALLEALNAGENAPLQSPTGSGKAYILARIALALPQLKILVAVDRQILVRQLAKTFGDVTGEPIGIASKGVQSKVDLSKRITISTRQTAAGLLPYLNGVQLLIADEAHLWRLRELDNDGNIQPNSNQFAILYESLLEGNPRMRLLGCTATPFALNVGYIYGKKHKPGLVPYFSDLTAKISVEELTDLGYLCKAKGYIEEDKIDIANVNIIAGEYNIGELSVASIQHVQTVSDSVNTHCLDRQKIIVFAVDIKHAIAVADNLRDNVNDEVVVLHSKLKKEVYREELAKFTSGTARIAVSVNQLSIGFDLPAIDAVILARKTMSPGLITQMIGRGLRPFAGKEFLVVVDLVGATAQHFCQFDFDSPRVVVPLNGGKSDGEAPFKLCPGKLPNGFFCYEELHPKVIVCPECGYKFVKLEAKRLKKMQEVEYHAVEPEWKDCLDMAISIHNAKSGKQLIKVQLTIGSSFSQKNSVTDWICTDTDYSGNAVRRGKKTWLKYCQYPMPVDDIAGQCWLAIDKFRKPSRCLVKVKDNGYYELIDLEFEKRKRG